MKRTILFRGFNENLDKWIYGNLIVISEDICFIENTTEKISVIPSSVGQFTGIFANKCKVFENDIVNFGYKENYPIVFSENSEFVGFSDSRTGVNDIGGSFIGFVVLNYYNKNTSLELREDNNMIIVGNVYENPELIL